MIYDGRFGESRVWATQPVDFATSMTISGVTASGLLTSRITSPVASSQNTAETNTSFGSNLTTDLLVSSSGILIDGSVRTTNLFFKVFERFDKWYVSSVSEKAGLRV